MSDVSRFIMGIVFHAGILAMCLLLKKKKKKCILFFLAFSHCCAQAYMSEYVDWNLQRLGLFITN